MDLKCHILPSENPPVVNIRKWTGKDTFTDFFFVGEKYDVTKKKMMAGTIICEPLFKDDIIDKILLKIMPYLDISENIYPYVWSKDGPLQFKITKNQWKNYDVNPFNAKKDTVVAPEVQLLKSKICDFDVLHVVAHADFMKIKPTGAFSKYYFPFERNTFKSNEMRAANREHVLLKELWSVPVSEHQRMISQSVCSYNRAFFSGELKSTDTCRNIFDKMHATALIQFIQLFDDINHIQYRLFKKHNVSAELFSQITDTDKMSAQKNSITVYSFIKAGNNSHVKFVLFTNNRSERSYQVSYMIDKTEIISYEVLQNHLNSVISVIKKQTGLEIDLKVDRLAVKTSISLHTVDMISLSAFLTKYPMIFNISTTVRVQKNRPSVIECQYIRVPKYGSTVNIIDLIKSKLEFNMSSEDIITEMEEYGISREDVLEYFTQIYQEDNNIPVEKRPKRDFNSLGLLIEIHPVALGLHIYINNASSYVEVQQALLWIRACVSKWKSENKHRSPSPSPEDQPPPPPPAPASSSSSESKENRTYLSDVSSLSVGGAGAAPRGFLISLLQNADQKIKKTNTYSSQCGASAGRQPIVMTLEHKATIDAMGYDKSYDNYLVYGSDPEKQNVYMCPQIYCPSSQLPLTVEQWKANGEKCPPSTNPLEKAEEGLLLYNTTYWHNDPNEARHVKLLKRNGLPCCFKIEKGTKKKTQKKGDGNGEKPKSPAKKTQKKGDDDGKGESNSNQESESESESSSTDKKKPAQKTRDEGYIINAIRQLEVNRYGTVPESLHKLLYSNIPYTSCTSTVKGSECILRLGIKQEKDSLFASIAYLLGFDSKTALCEHIKTVLDPFTFITLENGTVYRSFLPSKPVFLNSKNRVALKKWLEAHAAYTKLFDLTAVLETLNDEKNSISTPTKYKIARQLMIYTAYTRYIDYLFDDEMKNPYLLFDLVHHIGAVLIVWNRDHDRIATIRCPYAVKNKEWYNGQHYIPYIMVMMQHSEQQDTYYEPLVVVDQHKNLSQKIPFMHFEKLKEIIGACPAMIENEDVRIQNLYSLTKWNDNMLIDGRAFKIRSLVLTAHDSIKGCFLQNNIYLDFGIHFSLFSLKTIVSRCDIQTVLYWEDIQGLTVPIKSSRMDYEIMDMKVKKIGFISRVVQIDKNKTDVIILRGLYQVPKIMYLEKPSVPIVIDNKGFRREREKIQNNNEEWHEIKQYVLTHLLSVYDDTVVPLLRLSQKEKLLEIFKDLNNDAKVAVILEETPLHDKDLLKKAVDNLVLEKPYHYKDTIVHEGHHKKEWIFSQKVIERKMTENILYPTNIHRPKGDPKVANEDIRNMLLSDKKTAYPDMLDNSKLVHEELPTKWWRSKRIREYNMGILPTYSKTSMIDVFEWFAKERGIVFDKNDLIFYMRKQVSKMLEDPDTYSDLLSDSNMRDLWYNAFGHDFRSVNQAIQKGFSKKTVNQLKKMWDEICKNCDLPIQDIDLFNISKLLGVNFLILQKGKDTHLARGNLAELTLSSKFFFGENKDAWKTTPLFIFYKIARPDRTEYCILVDKTGISYYLYANLAPIEVQNIIQNHVSPEKPTEKPRAPRKKAASPPPSEEAAKQPPVEAKKRVPRKKAAPQEEADS